MRKAYETMHFFFGSLNILRIRNIFGVLIPITIRGGFDKKETALTDVRAGIKILS